MQKSWFWRGKQDNCKHFHKQENLFPRAMHVGHHLLKTKWSSFLHHFHHLYYMKISELTQHLLNFTKQNKFLKPDNTNLPQFHLMLKILTYSNS